MANNTRNGYEIRADLLGLAKQIAEFNYSIKYNEYEQSVRKEGDQIVSEFKYPSIQAEDIIATATKFNEFVTNGASIQEGTQTLMENVKKFKRRIRRTPVLPIAGGFDMGVDVFKQRIREAVEEADAADEQQ